MRIEWPKFMRCCLCVPMREGLISWAIFIMVSQSVMMFLYSCIMSDMEVWERTVFLPSLALMLLDVLFGLLLLIAALRAHYPMLKVYMYYGLMSIGAHMIIAVVFLFVLIVVPSQNSLTWPQRWHNSINFVARNALEIIIQLYIVLLVRSMVIGYVRRQEQIETARQAIIALTKTLEKNEDLQAINDVVSTQIRINTT